MLKKALILVTIVIVLCICCFGCENNNSIWYEVKTLKSDFGSKDDWDLKCVISSVEQIESIKENYEIGDELNDYNDDFFKEKSLILYLFGSPHGGDNVCVDSIQVDDKIITITMLYKEKRGVNYLDALTYWVCVIEVNSKDVVDCNQIIVKSITRITK